MKRVGVPLWTVTLGRSAVSDHLLDYGAAVAVAANRSTLTAMIYEVCGQMLAFQDHVAIADVRSALAELEALGYLQEVTEGRYRLSLPQEVAQ